jgi:hypothetical protein
VRHLTQLWLGICTKTTLSSKKTSKIESKIKVTVSTKDNSKELKKRLTFKGSFTARKYFGGIARHSLYSRKAQVQNKINIKSRIIQKSAQNNKKLIAKNNIQAVHKLSYVVVTQKFIQNNVK